VVRDTKVTCSGRIRDTRDVLKARDCVQGTLLQGLAPYWSLTGQDPRNCLKQRLPANQIDKQNLRRDPYAILPMDKYVGIPPLAIEISRGRAESRR